MKPIPRPSMVKMSRSAAPSRKLRMGLLPHQKPLPPQPPEPMAILDWEAVIAAPSGSFSGIEEGVDAVALVNPCMKRHATGTAASPPAQPPGRTATAARPAKKKTAPPPSTSISAVAEIGLLSSPAPPREDDQRRHHEPSGLPDLLDGEAVEVARSAIIAGSS